MRTALPLTLLVLALPSASFAEPGIESHRVETETGAMEVVLPARAKGPVATVVIIHGWQMGPEDFRSLARTLASRGYAAALYRAPDRSDTDPARWVPPVRRAIDALGRARRAGGKLGMLDLGRLGLVGFSLGGAAAIGTAVVDRRIKALVALAPGTHRYYRDELVETAGKLRIPALVVGGARDEWAPPDQFARPAAAAARATYVEIEGATHSGFSDIASDFMTTYFRREGGQQRHVANHGTLRWFKHFLPAKQGRVSRRRVFTFRRVKPRVRSATRARRRR